MKLSSEKTINVKVCGMRDHGNIVSLTALDVDYIGFIFYKNSKRYVGEEFDKRIIDGIPSNIAKVGVFVNEGFEKLLSIARHYGLNYVQLHGGEPVEYCAECKENGLKVIKAFNMDSQFDFTSMCEYNDYVDFFLFDTKGKLYGGTGKKFDWEILRGYDNSKPVFLSGGIGPEDASKVNELAGLLNIEAVDINSMFEIGPAIKDIGLVNEFIEELKGRNNK